MRHLLLLLAIALSIVSCRPNEGFTDTVKSISPKAFQRSIDGKEVDLYTLYSGSGMGMKVTNYGARIVALCVPDDKGHAVDVVCGYDNLDDYIQQPDAYFGAAIGRFSNRIAQGRFSLDSTSFLLARNDGENTLHGGPTGFHRRVWTVTEKTQNKIVFTYTSADGEEGYPGCLTVVMTYELSADNALAISYAAQTDQPTLVNLTHHSYFNLSGEGAATINDHVLQLNAQVMTPVDSSLIPTGDFLAVAGTPFDFTSPRAIGDLLGQAHPQLLYGGGYDHNFVIHPSDGFRSAARIYSPVTGIQLEVSTDQPGIQLYGGNFLDASLIGKSALPYPYRGAFCLETQGFPDAPNQPNFPSTELLPGDTYVHHCTYKFSVRK